MHHSKYILVLVLFLTACGPKSPSRYCSIRELLLNESDFPAESIVNEISSPVAEYPEASAGITASYKKDLMFHLVSRYPTKIVSSKKFDENLELYFREVDHGQSWEKPIGFNIISSIADQYIVACGISLGKYQCRMMGQYEDYYVLFFSDITDQGVDLVIFQELLQKFDQKMALCLLR
jgi:hypothetical protein